MALSSTLRRAVRDVGTKAQSILWQSRARNAVAQSKRSRVIAQKAQNKLVGEIKRANVAEELNRQAKIRVEKGATTGRAAATPIIHKVAAFAKRPLVRNTAIGFAGGVGTLEAMDYQRRKNKQARAGAYQDRSGQYEIS